MHPGEVIKEIERCLELVNIIYPFPGAAKACLNSLKRWLENHPENKRTKIHVQDSCPGDAYDNQTITK